MTVLQELQWSAASGTADVDMSHRSWRPVGAALVGSFLPLGVLALVVIAWSDQVSVLDQVLPALVMLITAGSVALDALRGEFDPFAPKLPAIVMLGVLFGARPMYMIATDQYSIYGIDMRSQFTSVALMGLLATVAFVIGTAVPGTVKRRAASPRLLMTSRGVFPALSLGTTGLVLFALNILRHGGIRESLTVLAAGRSSQSIVYFSDSSEYLSAAPVLLAVGAIVIVAATRGRPRWGEALLCCTLVSLAVGAFLLTGSRRFVIPSVLIPLVMMFLLRQTRPRARAFLLVGAAAFLVLGTIPYVRAEGARTQQGFVPLLVSGVTSPISSAQTFIGGHDTEMFPALGVEKRAIDEGLGYGLGAATVGDLVLAPIPSLIFPGKPATDRDRVLVSTFGASCEVTNGGVCPDFSATGTFYRDFGYLGVALGMFLLGLASGRLRVRGPADVRTVVLSAAWLVMLPIVIRAGLMPAFSWFLYFVVPSLVTLRLMSRRQETHRTA
jgi:hypothetical protein